MFESLEQRIQLTLPVVGGILTINGTANAESLEITLTDGIDRLDGRGGRDTMNGGAGFDTTDYSYRVDPLKVTLDGVANDGYLSGTTSELDNVQTEAVLGGTGADKLFGDGIANLLDGGV